MIVWRLGFKPNPCDFISRDVCKWNQRFDDFKKEYLVLYSAKEKITCLREVLHDIKPDKKAISELGRLFGHEEKIPEKGIVSKKLRTSRALSCAKVMFKNGKLTDFEKKTTVRFIQEKYFYHLIPHNVRKLTKKHIRGSNRDLTQTLSRIVFENLEFNSAGIIFKSRLDGKPCYALFENRAYLSEVKSRRIDLCDDFSELNQVCKEYNLKLESC